MKIGSINICGVEISLEAVQTDIDKLIAKIKAENTPIPEPEVIIPEPRPEPTPEHTPKPEIENDFVLRAESQNAVEKGVKINFSINLAGNYEVGYGKKPEKYYNFVGWVEVPFHNNWDLVIRSKTSQISKNVNIITKASFNEAVIKIEGIEPETQPTPIIVVENSPIAETGITDFDFLPIGVNTAISQGKALFQISSFSMGNESKNGMHSILSKNGKKLMEVKCNDDQMILGSDLRNNHMNGFNIIVPTGQLDIYYKNETNRPEPIMLGIGEVHKNQNAKFYSDYNESIFHKKLAQNEAVNTSIEIKELNDYGFVSEATEGSLHKQVNINLYKNGEVFTGVCEMDYSDQNTFQKLWGSYYQRCNSENQITIRSKVDHNDWIKLLIKVDGYGQTGRIKVLAKSNLEITEAGSRISLFNFNHAWQENGQTQWHIKEGFGDVSYKMYNNLYVPNSI